MSLRLNNILTPRYYISSVALALVCIGLSACQPQSLSCEDCLSIHNDQFWNTAEQTPLYSQGGGIFRYTDPQEGKERYFWYGMHYKEAETYRNSPTQKYRGCTFESVTIYVSDDLVNWHTVRDAITRHDLLNLGLPLGWLGRMGVVYIEAARKYVLMMQHNNSVLVATSDSPRGPFEYYRSLDMTSYCGTPNTGDQTVFVDPDTGRGYLVYCKANGRNKIFLSEIGLTANDSIGLLDVHEVFHGAGREGNCMFKYQGEYYLCASDLWGWDCSHAYFLRAKDIYGPYEPLNDMQQILHCERDFSHLTQTGFFYTHRSEDGKETVIYCGDRWANFANNGLGYNQWIPLSFDHIGAPIFNSVSSWHFNHATGEWHVARDNNYILNGSFDADRRSIPEPKKPRQAYLTGWDTEFITGRIVAHEDTLSPRLNRGNSSIDQVHVTGKMALNISDWQTFHRRVSQRVEETSTLPLPPGVYILQARIKGEGDSLRCTMFASSDKDLPMIYPLVSREYNNGIPTVVDENSIASKKDKDISYDLGIFTLTPNSEWQSIQIPIEITQPSLRIGFDVSGSTDAYCHIDDVTLVRQPQ